jgi:hypothetical protein
MPEDVVIFILGAVIGLFVSLAPGDEHLCGQKGGTADPGSEHLWLRGKVSFLF